MKTNQININLTNTTTREIDNKILIKINKEIGITTQLTNNDNMIKIMDYIKQTNN